jgi:DNA-binding XRE family transcriptional regulator
VKSPLQLVPSAPEALDLPSSDDLRLVRHVDQCAAGPTIAKTLLVSATHVQLGDEFKSHRCTLRWTQEEAAKRYRKDIRTIRRWERGESPIPSLEMDDIRKRASQVIAATGGAR